MNTSSFSTPKINSFTIFRLSLVSVSQNANVVPMWKLKCTVFQQTLCEGNSRQRPFPIMVLIQFTTKNLSNLRFEKFCFTLKFYRNVPLVVWLFLICFQKRFAFPGNGPEVISTGRKVGSIFFSFSFVMSERASRCG